MRNKSALMACLSGTLLEMAQLALPLTGKNAA